VKSGIRVIGVRAPIGIDAAQAVAVGLAEQCDAARREKNFHRIVGDQHPRRHRFGQAVHEQRRRAARLLFGELVRDQRRGLRVPRRHVGPGLRILIGDFRIPHAAPVGQLRQIGPVSRGRRRVDDRLFWLGSPDGSADRNQKATYLMGSGYQWSCVQCETRPAAEGNHADPQQKRRGPRDASRERVVCGDAPQRAIARPTPR